jgi:hypothetical protein
LLKQQKIRKRDKFERKNVGGYELIFPSEETNFDNYGPFLAHAKATFEDFN